MKNRIGIIGAGPAGIVAAGMAGKNKDNEVILIEKNDRIGKKLFITGKGRCNITNASPIDEFFDYITTNKTFMYSGLYSFTNENIMDLLNSYGLQMKVERGNRVFPKSDKSSDVIKTFNKFLRDNNVNVWLESNVENIQFVNESGKFVLTVNGKDEEFDKILISTGGKSYEGTGSTGDGFNYAKRFGHTVVDLKPSLVPIVLDEPWLKEVQGLSLRNVELRTYNKNKLIYEEFGEMIFTHFGISGPIVLTTSNNIHGYDKKDIRMELDFKPALSEETLDNRLLRDFEKYSNKQIKNALNDLLPQRIIDLMIKAANIDEETLVHQVTKEERQRLLEAIKGFPMKFDSFRSLNEAIVTSGGINVDEINPSTMESKIMPGLFFAGEVIDVDALTGGFNLQIAYSTGYLAGINM